MKSDGYEYVLMKNHPRADSEGYIKRCLVVAEKALGKSLLSGHPIHHIDKNKANDSNDNLVICENTAYHSLLHWRMKRQLPRQKTVVPTHRVCPRCKEDKPISNFAVWWEKKKQRFRRERLCHSCRYQAKQQYQKEYRVTNREKYLAYYKEYNKSRRLLRQTAVAKGLLLLDCFKILQKEVCAYSTVVYQKG